MGALWSAMDTKSAGECACVCLCKYADAQKCKRERSEVSLKFLFFLVFFSKKLFLVFFSFFWLPFLFFLFFLFFLIGRHPERSEAGLTQKINFWIFLDFLLDR